MLKLCGLEAQETIILNIPDITIYANELIQGNSDTYGRGVWKSNFTLEIIDDQVNLKAELLFLENQGDNTIITGKFEGNYPIPSFIKYPNCSFKLPVKKGVVEGANFGARGFRTFEGKGIIHTISIQTDTFGDDVGKVGGTIHFNPIEIIVIRPRA